MSSKWKVAWLSHGLGDFNQMNLSNLLKNAWICCFGSSELFRFEPKLKYMAPCFAPSKNDFNSFGNGLAGLMWAPPIGITPIFKQNLPIVKWELNWNEQSKLMYSLLGIDGRGGAIARWVFTKFIEIFRKISFSGGSGPRWAKYLWANFSSFGKWIQFRTIESKIVTIVLYQRWVNVMLSV